MKTLILLTAFYSTNILAMDLSQLTKIDVAEKCSTKKIIKALPANLTERIKTVNVAVKNIAKQLDVNHCLILAVVWTESTFKASQRSYAGAKGLMQVMPGTKRAVALEMGYKLNRLFTANLASGLDYHEIENLIIGSYYLKTLKKRFKSSDKAIMAYNIGPTNLSWKLAEDAGKRYLSKVKIKMALVTVNN